MTKSKKVSFLRGKRLRATVLDASGRPLVGESSVVTSRGFVTIGYTTNTEDGEAINIVNANGETCVSEAATPTFNGFGVEIEFCDVDFALFEVLTGQKTVKDEDGVVIGITESTAVDLTAVNFALEVWLGAMGTSKPSAAAQGQFGYVLTPFLGGGVIGDVTIENGAITFTITGMNTKDGSNWGSGPFNVELVAGVPAPLRTPMGQKDHRRIQHVEVAPPEVFDGATPLLDPTDPAVTSVTAVKTDLSVVFTPVPTGTDPMWYDLGDGNWDYAATGTYTHEYEAAGTYTVTAHRGRSVVTTSVVVTAP